MRTKLRVKDERDRCAKLARQERVEKGCKHVRNICVRGMVLQAFVQVCVTKVHCI